jgi:hypothetical protein
VRLVELLTQLEPAGIPALSAVLGASAEGRPLLVRFPAPAVGHALVVGDDCEGKNALMRTSVLSLALTNPQRHLQIALLDLQGGLGSLANLPHLLTPIVTGREAGLDVLRFLLTLTAQRSRGTAEPRIIVVVNGLRGWGAKATPLLADLAQQGPEAGLHLVCSLARPAGAVWEAVDWSHFVRLVGPVADEADRDAIGLTEEEVAMLDAGEFLAMTGEERLPFQAAQVSEKRAGELAFALWGRQAHQPLGEWLARRGHPPLADALGENSSL